ncbi:MAG: peptide chain release factor N(5)-glutamine methyltransferase [Gammaproteobacteria bacterium]|nr:MAG: peptide chain release factor N(5)-glutamine methyltransferase [Gammaproteobacteria bacterium]RLA53756.1 MAG: peptide chain release factor N(5)-glutamine methyltransferase [Gammaproteobacteria bacterium]
MSASRVSIAALLKQAARLQGISDTPRLDTEILLGHVLNKPRSYLYTWPEQELEPSLQHAFEQLLLRRQKGEPVAYLTGTKEFWSLSLQVNASTLIPRPETELLVETALAVIDKTDACVLDLGTGTGAIALALASERPGWQILAVDLMADALRLVEKNRQQLALNNVSLIQSDWFESIPDREFDLVVSNPPYIEPHDPHLDRGDVRFEPASALVAEDHGLADIKIIIAKAGRHLTKNAWLLLEHGFQQRDAVRDLLVSAGFRQVSTRVDINGQERLSMGCMS